MEQFEQVINWLREFAGPFVRVLVPVAVLVVGWLAALIVSALLRSILKRTQLDDRLMRLLTGRPDDAPIHAEKWLSRGVFYVLMLFVLVAFFETTGLTIVTAPLNSVLQQIMGFAPHLLSGILLLLVAWGLASLARTVLVRVLGAARVDERLSEGAGLDESTRVSIPENVGNVAYWLVFLIFLPAVLSTMGLTGLLEPVQAMTGDVIGFLPNVFASIVILLLGWFAARIVQRILTNLLAAAGVDRGAESAGLGSVIGEQPLSALIGRLAHALIIIVSVISALDALQFRAISAPATHMLTLVLEAIPSIALAVMILGVAYFVGRFIRQLVTDLLTRLGFNVVLARLGLAAEPDGDDWTPSQVVGQIVFAAMILFAAIEAADAVGFAEVADLLAQFTTFAAQVVMGLLILGIGIFLANLAARVIRSRAGEQGGAASVVVRWAVLLLSGAMALRQMGLAEDIINLAFGLLLGAVAVAAAIAFGLGAREAAAREVEAWLQKTRRGNKGGDA